MARDDDGIVRRVDADAVALIALEATGGLERPVAVAFVAAGFKVAVVNPRQSRDFAKATGRLAKTDALDADVLAHFASAVRPREWAPTSANRSNVACEGLKTGAGAGLGKVLK